ncbi:MAG: hypothetical protein JWO76_1930, partial [Nocardioides sp.]|nr:hypothetical protein [Nocardioides sp.]
AVEAATAAAGEHAEMLGTVAAARADAERAVAEQARLRGVAEEAAEKRAIDRSAVEAAVRRQAELAEEAITERLAAEEQARDLAEALAETRALLMDELTIRRRWWQRPQAVVLPPLPAGVPETEPERTTRTTPDDADELVTFGPPRSSRAVTVVLALAALAAAGFTVYAALAPLSTAVLVAAGVATVLLAVLAWRVRPLVSHVRIDRGLVDIVAGERHHRFDLRNDRTRVEMTGEPGTREWQVLFLRRSLEPVTVTSRMVDSVAFTETLRKWRPDL